MFRDYMLQLLISDLTSHTSRVHQFRKYDVVLQNTDILIGIECVRVDFNEGSCFEQMPNQLRLVFVHQTVNYHLKALIQIWSKLPYDLVCSWVLEVHLFLRFMKHS